jgi:hypothetical protein
MLLGVLFSVSILFKIDNAAPGIEPLFELLIGSGFYPELMRASGESPPGCPNNYNRDAKSLYFGDIWVNYFEF